MAHKKATQAAPTRTVALAIATALALTATEAAAQAAAPDAGGVTAGDNGDLREPEDSGVVLPAPMAEALDDLRRAGGGALAAEITPQVQLIVLLRQAARSLREGRQGEVQLLLREAALSARRQGRPFEMPRTLSELENLTTITTGDLQSMLQKQQQHLQTISRIQALLADISMGLVRKMNGDGD